MKHRVFSSKHHDDSALFQRTKWKLVLSFGAGIAVILLLMMLFIYFVLYQALLHNELSDLKTLESKGLSGWNHELEEHPADPKKILAPSADLTPTASGSSASNMNVLKRWDFVASNEFVILLDNQNQVYSASTDKAGLIKAAQAWFARLQSTNNAKPFISLCGCRDPDKGEIYAIHQKPVSLTAEGFNGTMIVGQDASSDWRLLQRMKIWLLGLAVFLIIFATGAGYLLSGRAMIPIRHAYAMQQEFVADASHEIRTPLSVMKSSVEILNEVKDSLPEFHRKVLHGMDDEINRMSSMAENLLALARSDAGQAATVMDRMDLAEAVLQVVLRMKPLADQQNIDLEAVSVPESLYIHGDEKRLKQVFYILIDNAIKYTPGEGAIDVEFKQPSEHEAVIRVKDTGQGIPEKALPHVFERFYRVDKARSRALSGNGLGLAIARLIVEEHRGFIDVMSKEGQGSIFEVHLPC